MEVPSALRSNEPHASTSIESSVMEKARLEATNKAQSPTDRRKEGENSSDRAGHVSLPVHDGADPSGNTTGVKYRGKAAAEV